MRITNKRMTGKGRRCSKSREVTEIEAPWNQSVCKIAILLLQQNIGTSSCLPSLGAERAISSVTRTIKQHFHYFSQVHKSIAMHHAPKINL